MTVQYVPEARDAPLLLTTKLYVPHARPTLLSRPRLLARLDAGLHGQLLLLSAPTGFGKTALLTDWLQNVERRAQNSRLLKIVLRSNAQTLCDSDGSRWIAGMTTWPSSCATWLQPFRLFCRRPAQRSFRCWMALSLHHFQC